MRSAALAPAALILCCACADLRLGELDEPIAEEVFEAYALRKSSIVDGCGGGFPWITPYRSGLVLRVDSGYFASREESLPLALKQRSETATFDAAGQPEFYSIGDELLLGLLYDQNRTRFLDRRGEPVRVLQRNVLLGLIYNETVEEQVEVEGTTRRGVRRYLLGLVASAERDGVRRRRLLYFIPLP